MFPTIRRSSLAILATSFAGLAAVSSCGDEGDDPGPSSAPPLRPIMNQMEGLQKGIIDVYLRNPDKIDEVADAGRRMLQLVDHPAFVGFTDTKWFNSNPEKFHEMRLEMKSHMEAFVFAAQTGNADGMHSAWEQADAQCIACHKRFNPFY